MRLEYFQMVDRLLVHDPDARSIRMEGDVPDQSPIFEGHFPGYPILPGVLMIETIAQTGGWLVLMHLRFAAMPFLLQVEKAKMRSFVSPGQRLETEARLIHDGSGYAVIEGSISSNGKKVCDAEIRYRVVPFPNDTLKAQMFETARRIGVAEEFFIDA
jgi:3-hydroxyacyl-[acyl-carrier-protein] dehydratase